MAVAKPPIHREVYRFLASGPSPEDILAFRPSDSTQARIRALLQASGAGSLTNEEQAELDEFEQVEHFVGMLELHTEQMLDE